MSSEQVQLPDIIPLSTLRENGFPTIPISHAQGDAFSLIGGRGTVRAPLHGEWRVFWMTGASPQGAADFSLPKFRKSDVRWNRLYNFWQPKRWPTASPETISALIILSITVRRLLNQYHSFHYQGLEVQFILKENRVLLEEVKRLAIGGEVTNHLLIPHHQVDGLAVSPSEMMRALMLRSGSAIFDHFREIDRRLPAHHFFIEKEDQLYLNFSALLDMHVTWGLSTKALCERFNLSDPYGVSKRWHILLAKWRIHTKRAVRKLMLIRHTRTWLKSYHRQLRAAQQKRRLRWQDDPPAAFQQWQTSFCQLFSTYLSLKIAYDESLQFPLNLMNKRELLNKLQVKSEGSRYLDAFKQVSIGQMSKEAFLQRYGHRGFGEDDIGALRWLEISDEAWAQLSQPGKTAHDRYIEQHSRMTAVFQPVIGLLHGRERLRHEVMKFYYALRSELIQECEKVLGKGQEVFHYSPSTLYAHLTAPIVEREKVPIRPQKRKPSSGQAEFPLAFEGECIYPGRVRGHIWKVSSDDGVLPVRPAYDKVILLADGIDPSWTPLFPLVDGVLSYGGNLYAAASVILRESRIPTIFRLPEHMAYEEGEQVEMDSVAGKARVVRVNDE